jgi:hypothetical protein
MSHPLSQVNKNLRELRRAESLAVPLGDPSPSFKQIKTAGDLIAGRSIRVLVLSTFRNLTRSSVHP